MKKLKILVFGNILVEEDNLALKILPKLQERFPDIEFKEKDPTESLEKEIEERELFVMDVVKNIKEIELFSLSNERDFEKLSIISRFSLHDFDLAYNLRLLKKIGILEKVKIIAIPSCFQEEEALEKVSEIIKLHLKS